MQSFKDSSRFIITGGILYCNQPGTSWVDKVIHNNEFDDVLYREQYTPVLDSVIKTEKIAPKMNTNHYGYEEVVFQKRKTYKPMSKKTTKKKHKVERVNKTLEVLSCYKTTRAFEFPYEELLFNNNGMDDMREDDMREYYDYDYDDETSEYDAFYEEQYVEEVEYYYNHFD